MRGWDGFFKECHIQIKACEVWMMDTGAGWSGGVLTMMNIDTKEIFQSDRVDKLYYEYQGRH